MPDVPWYVVLYDAVKAISHLRTVWYASRGLLYIVVIGLTVYRTPCIEVLCRVDGGWNTTRWTACFYIVGPRRLSRHLPRASAMIHAVTPRYRLTVTIIYHRMKPKFWGTDYLGNISLYIHIYI